MANQAVINENSTTAKMPMFSRRVALLFPISFDRLMSSKTGTATAGRITAWKACESTISAGGRCSRKIVPNVNSMAINISTLDWVECVFLGFPV